MARLVKRLEGLEAAAAAAARTGQGAIGLVWSAQDARVDAEQLAAGEWIACDVTLGELIGGAQCVRTAERVTCDERDLGWVHDAAGARVGRVVAILEPGLLEWELFAAGD